MIHVAEAGEAKGRVVLHLCSASPNKVAVDAAVWLARAFQSEIESLFVEDQQLLDLASFPFVREISFSGRTRRTLSTVQIERHFRYASAEFHRSIARLALAAEVPVKPRVIRDDPLNALAAACSETGPWNVVVLAEPFTSSACPSIHSLFERVSGTTGLLVVGPDAKRTTGPIVIALEQADELSALLATAERLALAHEQPLALCLAAEDSDTLRELEAAARLALADRIDVPLLSLDLSRNLSAAVAEALRRLAPGLVIGRYGGRLIPAESWLKEIAEGLECPILLVR